MKKRAKSKIAAEDWIVRITSKKRKLKHALKSMEHFKLKQKDVPFIIRFFENPKYNIGLFPGAVPLLTHDCIHIILGRGVLPKDEAFVIGYTMGSTNKIGKFREWLFLFCAKYLYPEGYKFLEEERHVFKTAMSLSSLTDNVKDLSKVNFLKYMDWTLEDIRRDLGISSHVLRIVYILESRHFPNAPESKRLK